VKKTRAGDDGCLMRMRRSESVKNANENAATQTAKKEGMKRKGWEKERKGTGTTETGDGVQGY